MKKPTILFPFFLLIVAACQQPMPAEDILAIGIKECRHQPSFIKNSGFQPRLAALSTSEKKLKGLVLVELSQSPNDTAHKTWQHTSWNQFGWMGPITTDESGNTYVAPVPSINVLDNPVNQQNIIYRVESDNAEMKPFIDLAGKISPTYNPYGLLGLYYDCYTKTLFAATVAGSTYEDEKGEIVGIDIQNKKIKTRLLNNDAMGICVGGMTGEPRLYFGSARQSAVYSVLLNDKGEMKTSPRLEFSLDMLGPRGDDKARRIRFDKNGDMLIYGIEFNYNLTAPSEKQESLYRFRYNEEDKKWIHIH